LYNIFINIKRKFIIKYKPFFLKRYKIAAIMNELIISGIDLMLTGMVTVLIFLSTLIILIHISATLFKEDLKDNIDRNKNTNNSVGKISNSHKEIINIINKRIFNE
jgi:Na+-transporting methylmalonyl-CoA/oxaloacetate decarboxylase gamma subunit